MRDGGFGHRLGFTVLRVSAIIILVVAAIMFVVEIVQDIQELDKLGTIVPADVDYLLSLMLIMISVVVFYQIIRDASKGQSLFTDANTERFLIIGIIVVLKIVLSVVTQVVILLIYRHLAQDIVFPMDVVLFGFMIFMLYFICKQGSRLREDVDSIV